MIKVLFGIKLRSLLSYLWKRAMKTDSDDVNRKGKERFHMFQLYLLHTKLLSGCVDVRFETFYLGNTVSGPFNKSPSSYK